jgi:hypothetical protein
LRGLVSKTESGIQKNVAFAVGGSAGGHLQSYRSKY